MHDIVIIGAGGLASEVAFLIDEINRKKKTWNILGYIVEDENEIGKYNGKYKIINTDSLLQEFERWRSRFYMIGKDQVSTC